MNGRIEMGKQIVTSVKVDEDIWKRAKIESIKRGMTLAEFLNRSIEEALRRTK